MKCGSRPTIRWARDAFDGRNWSLQLAGCCVVCGEECDTGWIDETYDVEDVRWAVWAPAAGFAGGAIVGFFFWWKWLFIAGILIGLAVGYRMRSSVLVQLRFKRDQRHAESTHVPSITVLPGALLVRVGNRTAKQELMRHRQRRDPDAVNQPPPKKPDGTGEENSHWSTAHQPKPELPPIPLDEEEEEGEESRA